MSDQRTPLYYTFGNHMHWVDMEWLWGYDVLPSSTRDMLHFCRETGAKGNINFDGIGYEKMASEAPEALAALREAVQRGQIEVVGASYGQPYGLFHGGESNVRQRVFGVRTAWRLLGARPRTFWEEEFDFCPQLPQILCGVGYKYAALFFQWTWHTPVVPMEDTSVIWWEGMDGSQLLAAPRNALNLHQWPEDFAGLLDSPALHKMTMPLILQWLELIPSPDWMCRSEVLLPPLRALLADPRFVIRPVTLSEFLEGARAYATPRRYMLSDTFHGMSLGKNGDRMRRFSRKGEQTLLAAESLSAMAGLFGRPYPGWDVYPVWELEEAWRELLAAQHHDNDECEALCGFIGIHSYERSLRLSQHVIERTLRSIARRGPIEGALVYNPLGWRRDAVIIDQHTNKTRVVRDLPPFGYRLVTDAPPQASHGFERDPANGLHQSTLVASDGQSIMLRRGALSVSVDRTRGVITQITSAEFPHGLLRQDMPLATLVMKRHGEVDAFEQVDVWTEEGSIGVSRQGRGSARVVITITIAPELDAVDVHYVAHALSRPDGGMNAALHTPLAVDFPHTLIHDHPFGVSEIDPKGVYQKKYPTGDWMTSPQWFEEVQNPFTALQLLDFDAKARGLLILHDGSQAFLRSGDTIRHILTMYDPWDEAFFHDELNVRIRLIPHGQMDHAKRWKLAQEFTRPALTFFAAHVDAQADLAASTTQNTPQLPAMFGPAWCDADNVALTALYRETQSDDVQYPYVLRLVEFNGQATTAHLHLPGKVVSARKTTLLGETIMPLVVKPDSALAGLNEWSAIALELRPNEIATIYLDLELGRKTTRNLDMHRRVWATVHRTNN